MMEKKTIGQFIAILRKANGMTQQDVADKLNVSNKAISRWERDECAPDITLIPAIAELFGVTCDELLKGERILATEQEPKREAKVEKRMKSLMHREISKYKTLMWIAVAVAAMGPIVMYILLHTAYWLDEACVGVMLLFEIVAFVIETIAVARMRDLKVDSELFENIDETSLKKYNRCLGTFSFWVYFLIGAVVLLPVFAYISMYCMPYMTAFLFWLVVILTSAVLVKDKYFTWMTGVKREKDIKGYEYSTGLKMRMKKMNSFQITSVALYGVVAFLGTYCEASTKKDILYIIVGIISVVLILIVIISIIVFLIKEKENRKAILFLGVRNILLFPSGYFFSMVHQLSWHYYENGLSPQLGEIWMWEFAVYAGVWALAVVLLYMAGKKIFRERSN